jgi:hypothetical protein
MDPLALRGSKGFKGKALLRLPRGPLVAWAAGRFLTALTTILNGGYSEGRCFMTYSMWQACFTLIRRLAEPHHALVNVLVLVQDARYVALEAAHYIHPWHSIPRLRIRRIVQL